MALKNGQRETNLTYAKFFLSFMTFEMALCFSLCIHVCMLFTFPSFERLIALLNYL